MTTTMTTTVLRAFVGCCVILATECKQCLIDERIGQREGNIYYCDDPDLQTCCEKDYKATCCEDVVDKTLMEQLILWGLVAVIILGFLIVYCCIARDKEVFESATVKVAFGKLANKFRFRKRQTRDFSVLRSTSEVRSNNSDVAPPYPPQKDDGDDKLRLKNDDDDIVGECRCSSTCHDFSDDDLQLQEAEEKTDIPPSRQSTVVSRKDSTSTLTKTQIEQYENL